MEHELNELSWRERGRLWLRLAVRILLIVGILLALRYLLPPLLSLFMPFVLALLLSWLLNPLVRTIQKTLGISRGILSLVIILLVFGGVGGLLAAFGYNVFSEVRSLVENWQGIWAGIQTAIAVVGEFLDSVLAHLPSEVEQTVTGALDSLTNWLQTALPDFFTNAAGRAGNFAMSIPSFAVGLVVFIMGTYFITSDYPHLRFLVTDHLSTRAKRFLSHVKHAAVGAFGGYVRAQIILSLGVLIILMAGFILTGQNYAVLLALLLAVLDFIPIIGAGTVMLPWAAVYLVMGNVRGAVEFLVIWGIICVFRRVAEPKAVGSQTGLSPILSLVSIYVGMQLAGVLGMILGPVLCMVAINICKLGLFDGLVYDLRLAVGDTALFLRNQPPDNPSKK